MCVRAAHPGCCSYRTPDCRWLARPDTLCVMCVFVPRSQEPDRWPAFTETVELVHEIYGPGAFSPADGSSLFGTCSLFDAVMHSCYHWSADKKGSMVEVGGATLPRRRPASAAQPPASLTPAPRRRLPAGAAPRQGRAEGGTAAAAPGGGVLQDQAALRQAALPGLPGPLPRHCRRCAGRAPALAHRGAASGGCLSGPGGRAARPGDWQAGGAWGLGRARAWLLN